MPKQKSNKQAFKFSIFLSSIISLLAIILLFSHGLLPLPFVASPHPDPTPVAPHAVSEERNKADEIPPVPEASPVATPAPRSPIQSSTSKTPRPDSWEAAITHKRLNYSSSAAFLTATDADGRKLEPTSVYGSLADPNDVDRTSHQDYDPLEYVPTNMQVEGHRHGVYNLQFILKGRQSLDINSIYTDPGMVDVLRHDDNRLSVTFDAHRQQAGVFAFAFLDRDVYQGGDKVLRIPNLPVLPGATFTFTVDWQALQDDRPSLTIAVDLNGDGESERSLTVGREPGKGGWVQQLELGTTEYTALFGEAAPEPPKE